MKKILVIGSSNTDLITNVERFPKAGETISGKHFMQVMGGKGANQAVAAHRLGGNVKFVTCLGNDSNGRNTLSYFNEQGLDVSNALVVDHAPTGTAVILVNDEGENCIVVTPGANHEIFPGHIDRIEEEVARAAMIMLQMEIPFATVTHVINLASKYKVPVLLNVAPAREIGADLLKLIEILVVNENEGERVSGQLISSIGEEGVIDKLLSMGAKTVILTLGKKGCIVKNSSVTKYIPAFEVEAVDTTGAGDTFCGAVAAALSRGVDLIEAVKFATAASAICVTRMGAQPSLPTEAEVNKFLLKGFAVSSNGKSHQNKPIV
ncbi:MAG TPA: ribokinase [Cyclobacteriaceae bacterium]|nr:ribokinase [Cyclobacteriaceae bacterium]